MLVRSSSKRACRLAQAVLVPGTRKYSNITTDEPYAQYMKDYVPKTPSFAKFETATQAERAALFSKALLVDNSDAPSHVPSMEYFVRNLQRTICGHLEGVEASASSQKGAKFRYEESVRDPATGMSGGGIVSVLQEGAVYEKAGVNVSVIHGKMPIERLVNMRADHKDLRDHLTGAGAGSSASRPAHFPFAVAGISLVLHPYSPHVPTTHANYRLFEVDLGPRKVWWMGGGSDLTPTYVQDKDARHFHSVLKQGCDAHDPVLKGLGGGTVPPLFQGVSAPRQAPADYKGVVYPKFKSWCDTYFRIPHRNESRGIGGIFFDDLDPATTGMSERGLKEFVTSCGDLFSASYFPVVRSNLGRKHTDEEKRFQQLRRGRYVEFNLMYDRGTKFGLEMPASAGIRTEAILMSLPLTARYEYKHTPAAGSPEARTQSILQNPLEWAYQ